MGKSYRHGEWNRDKYKKDKEIRLNRKKTEKMNKKNNNDQYEEYTDNSFLS